MNEDIVVALADTMEVSAIVQQHYRHFAIDFVLPFCVFCNVLKHINQLIFSWNWRINYLNRAFSSNTSPCKNWKLTLLPIGNNNKDNPLPTCSLWRLKGGSKNKYNLAAKVGHIWTDNGKISIARNKPVNHLELGMSLVIMTWQWAKFALKKASKITIGITFNWYNIW